MKIMGHYILATHGTILDATKNAQNVCMFFVKPKQGNERIITHLLWNEWFASRHPHVSSCTYYLIF